MCNCIKITQKSLQGDIYIWQGDKNMPFKFYRILIRQATQFIITNELQHNMVLCDGVSLNVISSS